MQERISLDQARSMIVASMDHSARSVEILSTHFDALTDLTGRTLAQSIHAPFPLPEFANSAMDGFALRAADLDTVAALNLQGETLAGGAQIQLKPAHCVRVTTGAALPIGADCVIMQENTETLGNIVRFHTKAKKGDYVRAAGEDFAHNALALRAGTRLGAAELAILHAFGLPTVRCYAPPRISILAGGEELRAMGETRMPGQIFESNRVGLQAKCERLGARTVLAPLMRDQLAAVENALKLAAENSDLVLTTGGASGGSSDFIMRALQNLGEVLFYRVRVKPGMPAIFGRIGNTPVLALPGNPVSVFASFLTLAKPALETLCGRSVSPLRGYPIPLADGLRKTHARREFLRAQLVELPGAMAVRALDGQGSAMLHTLASADGFIDLPEGELQRQAGDIVNFMPFSGLI
jgi:molybdopterin molybdotransferase